MKKNAIQFQHGESLFSFLKRFGSDEQCRHALFQLRWPGGFRCPECGGQSYCYLQDRRLYQCNHCHYQTSLIAGTLFEATKLPLKVWLLGMYLIAQSKDGISTLNLGRQLGVSQNSAWLMKHKLMQAMLEQENHRLLQGRVEVDDAYWGGERRGGKRGRGAPGKQAFVAAVETTEEGHPLFMKCSPVNGFRKQTLQRWANHLLSGKAHVISDALGAFRGIDAAGIEHEAIVTGGGAASMEILALQWVNIILGNLKNSIHGTYHAIGGKHLARYLAEFNYRFNRRFRLECIVDQLLRDAVRTPPMPDRLVKLAEVPW
jgi:transposase-like protein